MLSRFISKSSNLRCITSVFSRTHLHNLKPIPPDPLVSITNPHLSLNIPHFYSTNSNDNNGKDSFFGNSPMWDLSSEADDSIESIFGEEPANPDGLHHDKQPPQQQQMKSEKETQLWESESFHGGGDGGQEDIFREVEKEGLPGNEGWDAVQEYKPWSLAGDGDKQQEEDLFDLGVGMRGEESRGSEMQFFELGVSGEVDSVKKIEEEKQLEMEEKSLTSILKGPNRAFGDLIAASGITDSMLESLIALKDFEGIKGLPPLHELQDRQFYNSTKRSTRAEIERQKQEEIARARVRQVDDKGRAYGTGRRKCSIARVWIQPGDGKFVVNDKEFDVYFPMLDHRAVLLRPFSETKTLGMWNVSCTVKGGGVSGQVGAIRLGISRALQNWAPDMRPPLKQAGFLTRDSRVVERKKPGKAKARKSFQWVKR